MGDVMLEVYCLYSLGMLHIKSDQEVSEQFYGQVCFRVYLVNLC